MMNILPLLLFLAPKSIFVDPAGIDDNSGLSHKNPVRTISRAAQLAGPGDTVWIGGGEYHETVTVPHSGTKGSPIVFRAMPAAKATICADDELTEWKNVGGNRFTAKLPFQFRSRMNQADQLFVDGHAATLSRWPNIGPDPSRPHQATLKRFISKKREPARNITTVVFEDDDLKQLSPEAAKGASIYIQPNYLAWSWTLSGKVTKLEGSRITFESRNDAGKDGQSESYGIGSRYYLFGKSQLIDSPEEWWVDSETGEITVQLAEGQNLLKHRMTFKARDLGFDLSGRSFVTLDSLRFHGCAATTDALSGGDSVPYNRDGSDAYPWRPKGYVAESTGCQFLNLTIEYPNAITDVSGHFFFQWGLNTGLVVSGTDHLVQGCRVRFAEGNGITLIGRRIRCLGNTVTDSDLKAVECAAICTGANELDEDIEIGYNTIDRTGRSGIGLRNFTNSPGSFAARVHHNLVQNYLLQDWDGGAFYTVGTDGRFARIDHNIFQITEYKAEAMVFGIYFDYSKNFYVDHNLCLGMPTPVQITREFDPDRSKINNLILVNNTCITNDAAWGRPIFSSSDRGSIVMNNLFKVCTFANPNGQGTVNHWPAYGTGVQEGSTLVGSNVVFGDDPNGYYAKSASIHPSDLYVDRLQLDERFRPAPGSLLGNGGRKLPKVTRDGISVPPFSESPGSHYIGAFEPSVAPWTAGTQALIPAKP